LWFFNFDSAKKYFLDHSHHKIFFEMLWLLSASMLESIAISLPDINFELLSHNLVYFSMGEVSDLWERGTVPFSCCHLFLWRFCGFDIEAGSPVPHLLKISKFSLNWGTKKFFCSSFSSWLVNSAKKVFGVNCKKISLIFILRRGSWLVKWGAKNVLLSGSA